MNPAFLRLAGCALVLAFRATGGIAQESAAPHSGQISPPTTPDRLEDRVADLLRPRLQTAAAGPADEAAQSKILARPDPGTSFGYYIFGLRRHAAKLLSADQAERLERIIAERSPISQRWHDERNTLRCKFNQVMWRYAGVEQSEAPSLRNELAAWMRLRMTWTQQEHLAAYRFSRAVWDLLSADQQRKLTAGQWSEYAKMDTGHTRENAAQKIITRALGEPDDAAAFKEALDAWSTQRGPLHEAVRIAEDRQRRLAFALDLNSEAMLDRANREATEAFASLYLAEAEAFRRIVQAAYRRPQPLCAKAAAEAWSEAQRRFQAGAAELIQLLDPP